LFVSASGTPKTAPMRRLATARGLNDSTAINNDRPRVIVVGAGFAGLSAAKTLASKDIDVKVLEAGTRVGGRACTAKVVCYVASSVTSVAV
jgi:ribulose 1,5-bisphosphate synthetase/thiazole synthase